MSRLLPFTGLAFFLLIMIGNSIAVGDSNTGPDSSAAEIVADIHAHDGAAFWFGLALEVTGLVMLPVFAVYVVRQLRGAGRLATVALAGALFTAAVKLTSGVPVIYAVARVDELSAGTVKTLMDVGAWAFVASWLGIAAFTAAAGIAAARSGLLARPLGYAGAVFGALVPIGMAVDVQSGGVPGFMLGLLWLAVVSVVLGLRELRAQSSSSGVRNASIEPSSATR